MSSRPLPPYGRAIVAMLDRHECPDILGGAIVAALEWDIGRHWPRVVIAGDPAGYRLDFAAGLDWFVLARVGHDGSHVAAVVRALRSAGARIVAPAIHLVAQRRHLDADRLAQSAHAVGHQGDGVFVAIIRFHLRLL